MSKQKTTKTIKKAVKKKTKTAVARRKSVKKTAKKATNKSAKVGRTTKKAPPRKIVKALVCAKDGECFWTTDGTVLRDLNQLQLAFGTMNDEVFLHHVTKEKNDFADWVETVLDDAICAQALRRSRKPSSARTVVVRYVQMYRN